MLFQKRVVRTKFDIYVFIFKHVLKYSSIGLKRIWTISPDRLLNKKLLKFVY